MIETGRPTVQTLVNMIMMQLEMAPPGRASKPLRSTIKTIADCAF